MLSWPSTYCRGFCEGLAYKIQKSVTYTSINNSLYITMSAKVKVSPCTSQAAWIHCGGGRQKLPPGADSVHTVQLLLDQHGHTFFLLFFFLVNTQGKDGRGKPWRLVAVRFIVQVNWITGRHTGI